MAIAHDALSESHTGVAANTSGTSFSWLHTPVGSPKSVLVYVFGFEDADVIISVDYGGVNVPAVEGGWAIDTVAELQCKAFHLGDGNLIPTGPQTITVHRVDNGSTGLYATCHTATALTQYTEVYLPGIVLQADPAGTLAAQNITDGTSPTNSLRYAGLTGDHNTPPTPAAASTGTTATSIDVGSTCAQSVRETNPGIGSRPVGWTDGGTEGRAGVYLAVRELEALPPVVLPDASASQIEDALSGRSGPVRLSYRFEQRSTSYAFIADLTAAVEAAEITLDNNRTVIRTATFTLKPESLPEEFDPAADYVAVIARLLVPVYRPGTSLQPPGYDILTNDISMGLFRLDVPRRHYEANGRTVWEVEASDLTGRLITAKTATPYLVASGTNYITAVETIFDLIGFEHDFPAVGDVTPVAFAWAPGTSYAQIVNDLLFGINFYPAWPDNTGIFTSRERIDPVSETPAVVYSTNAEPRLVTSPFERLEDRTRFPNQVVVIIDDPRRTAEYALRVNDDPDSPISVYSLGVTNFAPELSGGRVVDLPTAQEIADFELKNYSAESLVGALRTFPDPRRSPQETYQITIESVETASRWKVQGWQLNLTNGTEMEHAMGEAINIDTSIVVTLSGTITTATEANIVSGGRTIILDLPTNYSWVAAGATFDAIRQDIIDAIASAGTEVGGWNATVSPALVVTNVVRTSATRVTITLPAVASYSITVPETVTVYDLATAITGALPNVTQPTFTII